MKYSSDKIYSFILSLLLSFGFGAACLKLPALNAWISSHGNINLLTYALTVVLFCALYFLFTMIFTHIPYGKHSVSSNAAFAVVFLLTVLHFIFLFFMFRRETDVYASFSFRYIWHVVPLWIVMLCIVGMSLCLLAFIRRSQFRASNLGLFSLYGILTILVGYNFYTPAVFLRDEADRLHMDAYFNSIYNVMHGNAYTHYTTSIYGHYGIFYKLPMKLLGGDFIDFILLNACIGALCFAAMFLALHFIVKNDLLRFLGAIAMTLPVLSMRSGIYWQLWPHRILFMALMLCYGAFCVRFRKLNRLTRILGYLLAMAGILWNTESGLFCAAAWVGFWCLHSLCDTKRSLRRTIVVILLQAAGLIVSFLGAYGIVELYNISCGASPAGMREFLFPLLQSSYMDDLLRVDLPDFPSAYIAIMFLLFLATAWGISHMRFFVKQQDISSDAVLLPCFSFMTAVLALGQLTYFINRAAYHNLEICHLPCVLLLCLLAESGMDFVKNFHIKKIAACHSGELFHGAFTTTALVVLLCLASGNIIQYGYNTSLREQLHNKQDVHDFAANVAANIPENTYGFGIGIPEIYAMLRWDTQCYTLDFADLSLRPEVGDHVMDDIREKDLPGFIAGENAVKRLKKYSSSEKSQWLLEHYELSQTFEFQGAVLEYYTKK